MANSGLAKMAKRTLDRLKMDIRADVQDNEGQIFVWNHIQFKQAMEKYTTPEIAQQLVEIYRTKLKGAQAKILLGPNKKRLLQAKTAVITHRMENYNPSTHELYAVSNYSTVQSMKSRMGDKFKELTGKDKKLVTGRLDKGDNALKAPGEQIGHGEFGHAVSTTKVLGAKSVMSTKTSQKKYAGTGGFKAIEKHIHTYEETMDVELGMEHVQHITARGKFKKSYTAVMSGQLAELNMSDAQKEKAALAELIKSVEKEYATIVDQEGSDTLLEAVTKVVVLGNLTGKHIKHVKGAKPKKESKSKGKGRSKSSRKVKNPISVLSGSGAPKVSKKRSTKQGVSSSPLRLIGLINNKLPDVVKKNMGSPKLINQSGRFAESTRIVDMIQTPQGYPSFGYTYQKNPYQTFEPGYNQGDPEKDPRKVIDQSIREIAINFAVGRFYTRRL
jgi:hypothetical protein